jgi:hypothetical protein
MRMGAGKAPQAWGDLRAGRQRLEPPGSTIPRRADVQKQQAGNGLLNSLGKLVRRNNRLPIHDRSLGPAWSARW